MPFLTLHGGARVRYREAGAERAGTPVVLVHGAGASSAIFLGLVHRLARHHRVVAFDLPGHGQSPGETGSPGAAGSVDELRDALGAACAALCLPSSVLVGHSLGGLVALSAALAWPGKVAALALVGSGARLGVSPATFAALTAEEWPRWPERLAELAYAPDTDVAVRRRGAAIACAASREQTERDFRACAAFDARERLGELALPVLAVSGEHDLLAPPRWSEALAASVPGARHVRLPACGHMPMHEQPDRLAAELLDFLGGFRRRTR